jgi:hypothetical protein
MRICVWYRYILSVKTTDFSRILRPILFYVDNQCCGSWISRIRIFSILDPGYASKNLSILTQKMVSKLLEIRSGLFIPDPDPDFLPKPNPGVKKAPDLGSGSVIVIFKHVYGFLTPFLGIYKNFCCSIIHFHCTLHLAPRRDSKPGP